MRKIPKLPTMEYLYWAMAWLCFHTGDLLSKLPWYWSANGYQWFMEVSTNLSDKLIEFDGPWDYIKPHLVPEVYKGRLEEEQLTWFKDNLMQLDDLEICLLEMEAGFRIRTGFCHLKNMGFVIPKVLETVFYELPLVDGCGDIWWFDRYDTESRIRLVRRARKRLYKRLMLKLGFYDSTGAE